MRWPSPVLVIYQEYVTTFSYHLCPIAWPRLLPGAGALALDARQFDQVWLRRMGGRSRGLEKSRYHGRLGEAYRRAVLACGHRLDDLAFRDLAGVRLILALYGRDRTTAHSG